jgi:DNA-binding LytR/AlgR family response regulator
MYTCIIIDDEQHAVDALKKYVGKLSNFQLIACFTDPIKAFNSIPTFGNIDLILLDIDMPEINGLELSGALRGKTSRLIFTTGHSRYGYEAFKADANDFLLKPYTFGEFFLSISKLFPVLNVNDEQKVPVGSFFVKSKEENSTILNIRFEDIIAVESKMNYVMIHTIHRKVTAYITLSEMAQILSKHSGFQRFQRSFIIAERYIDSITGNCIRMSTGLQMTVGEYYRKDFSRFVSKKLIKTGRR